MKRKITLAVLAAAVCVARPVAATTYYVSPTGNDAAAGTSALTPWASVTKVDATAFQPGDSVLFQYGGQWAGQLNPASSGTVAAPITFAAYGNSALAQPTFTGSDAIANSAFAAVAGTSSTFAATVASPVNWVFDNHQFTHEAQDATGSADPLTDLTYVLGTAGSFYYNAAAQKLYVNPGTATLAGHSFTLAARADPVLANFQNNLVFQNLAVAETAQDNAGYGFRVQNADNVQLVNCTAIGSGKHAFGVINSTGFVGTGLTAVGTAPDLGYGGASAFVAYADDTRQGTTSQWVNCTYNQANGAYAAFISHGGPGSIASVKLVNMTSLNGYGTGIDIQGVGRGEAVTVAGGHFDGGGLAIEADNAVVSGVTITGSTGYINLAGNGDVASGNLISGISVNAGTGHFGGIVVTGSNDVVRDNTFAFADSAGGGIAVLTAGGGNTLVYGNTFQDPTPVLFYVAGAVTAYSGYGNTYAPGSTFVHFDGVTNTTYTLAQWVAAGYESVPAPTAAGGGGAAYGVGGVAPFLPGTANSTSSGQPTFGGIPEPAAGGLLAVGSALLASRRRR